MEKFGEGRGWSGPPSSLAHRARATPAPSHAADVPLTFTCRGYGGCAVRAFDFIYMCVEVCGLFLLTE